MCESLVHARVYFSCLLGMNAVLAHPSCPVVSSFLVCSLPGICCVCVCVCLLPLENVRFSEGRTPSILFTALAASAQNVLGN